MNSNYDKVVFKTREMLIDKTNKINVFKIRMKLLAIYILRHRKGFHSIYGWKTSLLALSILNSYEIDKNEEDLQLIEKYCLDFNKKVEMKVIDFTIMGEILLTLKKIRKTNIYDDSIHAIYDYVRSCPEDNEGSKLYRINDINRIFADTIGMICPFLAEYSEVFSKPEALEIAITQIDNYIKNGIDEETGLFYHGYEQERGLCFGIIGWGRAEGWILRGMTSCIKYMNSSIKKSEYQTFLESHFNIITNYLIKDKYFSWQLSCRKGHVDTSAMSMILCSMIEFHNSYNYELNTGLINGLLELEKDGKILSCSAECNGLSEYPQNFGTYDFGQAFFLLFLTKYMKLEGNKNGK